MLATLVLGAPLVNVSSSVVIQSLPILGPVFATIDETIHSSDALVLKAAADLSGAEDQFARDLFAEHNIARTTPSVYADTLAQLLPYFRSATVLDLPGRTDLRMEEGKAAFEEAIDFLREQRPLAPLTTLSRGLTQAAQDHVADSKTLGLVSHTVSGTLHLRPASDHPLGIVASQPIRVTGAIIILGRV